MTQEEEAIACLKQGDIAGLESLVSLHQAEARQVVFLITENYALSEDIVQTAFIRAYERIHQFDSARPFRPWFLRSVINDARMAVKRRVNVPLDSLDPGDADAGSVLASPDPGLYEMFEAAQTREAVWATLAKLSADQRAAVVMHYYLDLSSAEISRSLNLPAGTIRRRLHDARQNLRRLLPSWVNRHAHD